MRARSATTAAARTDAPAAITLGELSTLLGFHMRMAYVAMRRHCAESIADLDLPQRQYA
jgi:hypothetical protein